MFSSFFAPKKHSNFFFDKEEITLTFDEFVTLKDVSKQLIISPPLSSDKYKVYPTTGASKKVNIKLTDTLFENTTYTFNFGESIADHNEGNLFPYYKYVFSTGDYIDSLSVSGVVTDALNKKVDDRIAVLLYDVDSTFTDSIIYKQKPKYIVNTDSVSGFNLENIKEGTYFLAALKEENPKMIKMGDIAEVELIPYKPLCIDPDFNELNRFAIRDMGMTIGVGRCIKILE